MAENKEFKEMVRLIDIDVRGNKSVLIAIQKIRGVGFSLANAICLGLGIKKNQQIGSLDDKTLEKIQEAARDPKSLLKLPNWMVNRQKDYESGEDKHLLSADLKFTKENDIKRLKKIKAYRGMRHSAGLPVRGQRTKSHFRKGKALGVQRKTKGGGKK